MLIGQRGHFFFILLREESKILVFWLPRHSYSIKKFFFFFSVIMTSCFEIVDEEHIEELKDQSENEKW